MTKYNLPNAYVFLARATAHVVSDWIRDTGFKNADGVSLSRAREVYASVNTEAHEAFVDLLGYASDLSEQVYRAWSMHR